MKAEQPEALACGHWSGEEHEQFLAALDHFGKDYKNVCVMIPTKNLRQINSHAQKFFVKVRKEIQRKDTLVVPEFAKTFV